MAQAGGQMGSMAPKPNQPLPSPAATAETKLGTGTVTIHYNSPAMRGRTIMGGLVPYGQVWRTGANPATTIVTTVDYYIGKTLLPAGTHTLYSLPDEHEWQLILNNQTGQWGTEYHQDQDLARLPMGAKPVAAPQESMTISFEHTTPTSTELHVRWETTDRYVILTSRKDTL